MLDYDRKVALEQLSDRLRPAFAALWKLDLAFADVVATSSDPRLGAIRLAWWRERLEGMDESGWQASEPRLLAVQRDLVRNGISGAELSGLEQCWEPLLEPFPWSSSQADGLGLRGRLLFRAGAQLLGAHREQAEEAGTLWSLVDGMRHCSDPASRDYLLSRIRGIPNPATSPRALRPLTILTALALSSLNRQQSGMAQGISAVWHRLTGHYPGRSVIHS